MAELLRQGSVVNYEVRLKKRDGTPIYGSINATLHRSPNGEVDWIDGMVEDITERKRAERQLSRGAGFEPEHGGRVCCWASPL